MRSAGIPETQVQSSKHPLEMLECFIHEHPRIAVATVMLLVNLLVYAPFIGELETVARFLDGPMYVVVAKTFYTLTDSEADSFSDVPAMYFACHLPAYPLVIRICSILAFGDYTIGLLVATTLCAIAAAILFYTILVEFQLTSSPLWSSMLFCFFPPRWLVYHSGSGSEPLFLCFVFACFLFYRRRMIWLVVAAICCASLTRVSGVLLGPIFLLIYVFEGKWKDAFLVPFSGIGILLLFWLYHVQFGDFFAYFTWNLLGEKIVRLPPLSLLFSLFETNLFRETEYYLILYGFYGLGVALVWRHRPFFVYASSYFVFTLFINHSDVTRYFLSMAWVAIFVGFDRLLAQRPFRMALLFMAPLYFYYAWGYIPKNGLTADAYQKILSLN